MLVKCASGWVEEEGDHETEDINMELIIFVDLSELSFRVVKEIFGEDFINVNIFEVAFF